MDRPATPGEVIAFWREAGPTRWFNPANDFDALCRERFLPTYERAASGELNEWELSPDGALALLILLDQLPRNMFRGERRSWATDAPALLVAERALDKGFDQKVEADMRRFFALPFTHAEDLPTQERSVRLYEEAGDADGLEWGRHHRDIIARFGRFPHRNAILGRESTPEEMAFLAEDGFRG